MMGVISNTLINWICVSCISSSLTLIWLKYGKRRTKNCTKVLLYEPIDKTTCNCLQSFTVECLSPNCSSSKTKEILLCLKSARKTMDICMFAISNKPIANEIIAAHKRGVLVRVVVCNCILFESKEIQNLKNIGIKLKYQEDFKSSYMHHKFAIIDSKWLIQGSMNWTHQATYGNWESSIITDLQSLVIPFTKGFEKTWEKTILIS
ncbi:mitochondrial cardiolipin hydrolase [Acyrthosiphon pisum]|uniref:Mitochondrial cardiolipin hydrolase n=1 Tax=Acyrthosiphon pisum TaxID=7029 RepID=A0A8R2AI11_ACYPI|nr:mitochondrial cardiolipin hydrolase [Acyrthosiphon pisum]|eukprot:XP_003247580.1 PREDICTED: mitochondrial cardiolipin hydrolase [Acyrthosiphon pisum]